jgi:predicted ArsR family transcriptional regulator
MDALEAIGDRGLRSALGFVRARPSGVTADDLAQAFAVHRNVARSRLERLADAGLIVARYERRSGRTGPGAGRPAKLYEAPPQVAAVEFPARRYESLLRLLLETVPARDRRRRLRRVGERFGRELAEAAGLVPAEDFGGAAEKVCDALARLGFPASVEQAAGGEAVITTASCPLRAVVVEAPDAAEIDRGVWAGLLASAAPAASSEAIVCAATGCLEPSASCRLRIELKSDRRRDSVVPVGKP